MTYSIRWASITLVLAMAGCSTPAEQPTVPAPLASASAAQQRLPSCQEMFQPGKPVDGDKANGGCKDPDGGIQFVGVFRCNDGSHLWQVNAATGAPAGYAVEGKPYRTVKGEIAADAGYKRAYDTCMS